MAANPGQEEVGRLDRLQITLQRLQEANDNEKVREEALENEMDSIVSRREARAGEEEAREAKLRECLAHCARIKNLQTILQETVNHDIEGGLFDLDEQRLVLRESELRKQHFELRERWIGHEMEMKRLREAEELAIAVREEARERRRANRERERALHLMREEEAVFRSIERARSIEELERIDLDDVGIEASDDMRDLHRRRLEMFKEHRRAMERARRFRACMEMLNEAATLEEVDAVDPGDLADEHGKVLEDLRERRREAIKDQNRREYQRQRKDEVNEAIQQSRSTTEIDAIDYEGVEDKIAWDLRKLAAIKRQTLMAAEISTAILGCDQVPILDEIVFEGVTEEAKARLLEAQNRRREELVDQLRQVARLERFNESRTAIVSCEDIEELLAISLYNVGETQHEHLESLRAKRLDELEEEERRRIEAEQRAKYEEILREIHLAESSDEVAAISIDGVNEEQDLELQETRASIQEILLENENVAELVAEALQKSPLESSEMDSATEFGIIRRLEDNNGHHGDVQFTLVWDDENDLDMVVRTPSGAIIHRADREGEGGIYDIEMNFEPESDKAVENVVWTERRAVAGSYDVFVWFRGRHGRRLSSRSTEFTLRTRVGCDVRVVGGELKRGDPLTLAATVEAPEPNARAAAEEAAEASLDAAMESLTRIDDVTQLPDANAFSMRTLDRERLAAAIEDRRQHIVDAEAAALRREQETKFRELRDMIEVMPLGDLREFEFDGVAADHKMELDDLRARRIAILERALEKQRAEEERAALEARLVVVDEILDGNDVDELQALDLSSLPPQEKRPREKQRVRRIQEIERAHSNERAEAAAAAELREVLDGAARRLPLEPGGENRRREFEARKEQHGCENGEVAISLIWDDRNDLNLIVQAPSGEIIHPRKRSSTAGGVMDVDMNTRPQSQEPIEHIRWTHATPGEYRVFVHHFAVHRRFRSKEPSPYSVLVHESDRSTQYCGILHPGDPVQFVTGFSVSSRTAPPENEEAGNEEAESEPEASAYSEN